MRKPKIVSPACWAQMAYIMTPPVLRHHGCSLRPCPRASQAWDPGSRLTAPPLQFGRHRPVSLVKVDDEIEESKLEQGTVASPTSSSSSSLSVEASTSEASTADASWATLVPGLPFVLLNLVTVLWGTQHAVIKSALLASPDMPGVLNCLRFGLASLLFLPWLPSPAGGNKGLWKAGAELGLWMFLGYALQAIGLGFTTASRSGFLLYLNVKLVPLFAWVLLGRKMGLDVWLSAFIAFLGTALLSFDGSPPNIGDLWSILAAAASAMFILRLESASQAYPTQSRELNSATFVVTTAMCGVWAALELSGVVGGGHGVVAEEEVVELVRRDWPQILYLGGVTTAVCNFIQTVGQRYVPAEKAALIYAMDPVYGAIFARLLLGQSEALGPQGVVGGGLVTSAAVFATLSSLWAQGGSRSDNARERTAENMGEEEVEQGEGVEMLGSEDRERSVYRSGASSIDSLRSKTETSIVRATRGQRECKPRKK